ncbi:hypothetical protein H312_03389 [Anncaliia algerae PRA339]|uniref:Uncharacterized protein n=1 Tax=Anncaliia algerae PRA339 TaxID=1288291 RepID=A0A059EWD2_9MICR|nr:hypothetical protein H312_03389 [Anncaliia algerae PRA339]
MDLIKCAKKCIFNSKKRYYLNFCLHHINKHVSYLKQFTSKIFQLLCCFIYVFIWRRNAT